MSRWRCSSLSICEHVHVVLNLQYNHVLNLYFVPFFLALFFFDDVPNIVQQFFSLTWSHTAPHLSSPWSGGPGWWIFCHPSCFKKTETFPESFLSSLPTHTERDTSKPPQPGIPVLSQWASGCRAREQEAPRLSQLFQTPLLPWAPHSLIQGSFVVLTSWNSWAAQLLMLL